MLVRAQSFVKRLLGQGAAQPYEPPQALLDETVEERKNIDAKKEHPEELHWHYELKRKLNKALPRDEAFMFYRAVAGLGPAAAIRRKAIVGLSETAKARAREVFLSFQGPEDYVLAPPTVFGEGNEAPVPCRARTMLTACFADARVKARSSFIELKDVAVLDFEEPELSGMTDHLDYDPALFWAEGRTAWVIDDHAAVPDVELEEAFTLLGAHSWEFGHWFMEYMPKFLLAMQTGRINRMPILLDAGMPEQHRQAIELLAGGAAKIVTLAFGQSARVKRLWCATGPAYPPVLDQMDEKFRWGALAMPPKTYIPLMDEMVRLLDRVAENPASPKRIFFARRPYPHRVLRNAAEIEEIARSRGFEIIYTQDKTFLEQVQLIRNAAYVVGPEGSALFLGFIGKAGTKVMILNHPLTLALALVTNIFEGRGMSAQVLTGPIVHLHPLYPHQSDYVVDAGAFTARLDEWLGEPDKQAV
jgi:hypothetical protein